jgi:glucosamine kinase
VTAKIFLLGVDGGGTKCRARLCDPSGQVLGEAASGPANLRLGVERSFSAILYAASEALERAGLSDQHLAQVVACLALAGASEPGYLAAAEAHPHPFGKAIITTDAHAACLGAHGEEDGGIIVAGTGTIGWATLNGEILRVGGWGLPVSDEGGGAWIGGEALRRVLWALDGRTPWTGLLNAVAAEFDHDPHAIVRWTQTALPCDFGALAPRVFDYAERGDPIARELMERAARHLDRLAARLIAAGATRLALTGGCAPFLRPWLCDESKAHLVTPRGDPLQGALHVARVAAQPLLRVA